MFYGIVVLGVVLGGLVLIYSLLAKAQKGDEFYDQLDMEQSRAREYAPSVSKRGEPENLGAPATFDFYQGGTT